MDTLERLTQDPYSFLGVKRFINATCHWTRFGGTLIPGEVMDAMREASRHYVDMPELQKAGGRLIAQYTHAEDGLIVSGCAAAMLVGTAAVLTGDDPARMMQLPDTSGMKGVCVAKRFERRTTKDGREYAHYGYAHAVKTAGMIFTEVGSDGGVVTAAELQAALTDGIGMVYWVGYSPEGDVPLEEVVRISHARGVPVLKDASNSLPPRENLHRYMDIGADLVCYSGGKGLQGPQGAGILAGRADLIAAARMQSAPNQGIGRVTKVSKEEIVGQLAALVWWAEQDSEARMISQMKRTELLAGRLTGLPGASVEMKKLDRDRRPFPMVHVKALPASGLDRAKLMDRLYSGDPGIAVMAGRDDSTVILDVRLCEDSEIEAIARRLREIFRTA